MTNYACIQSYNMSCQEVIKRKVIYLDEFFVINFIMDFIVLCITKKICKFAATYLQILLSATFGALWSVIALIVPENIKGAVNICTYILISALMIRFPHPQPPAHPPPVPASPHPPPGRLPPQVPACRNLRATGSPSHPALPAPSSVPQTVHCTIHTVPCALNLPLHGQFLLCLAALYHKRILVVTAVSVSQCCLVICVEEILLAECLDLLIDPV